MVVHGISSLTFWIFAPPRRFRLIRASQASGIWEIQIKTQLGKLSLRRPLFDVLTEQQQQNGIKLLPIELEDILSLAALPFHHRAPFDRLILAQTIRGGMHLVSHDTQMARYPAPVLWA